MKELTDDETHFSQWARRQLENGLMPEEVVVVRNVRALLAGALASAADVLERPSEAAVLEVFRQICARAGAPIETPIR